MNKQPLKVAQTRQEIEQTFIQLYEKTEIEHISIKAITAGAHINRSTFYLHYQDIYDRLATIEAKQLDSLQTYIEAQLPVTAITEWLKKLTIYFQQHGELLYLLMRKSRDYHFKKKIGAMIQHTIREITGITGNDQRLNLTLNYITETFIFFLEYSFEQAAPVNQLYPIISDLLHHGVLDTLTEYATVNSTILKQL